MNDEEQRGRGEPASVPDEPGLRKEQIALPDGRYLIYYTFPAGDDAGDVSLGSSQGESS
ncbi:MAG TPA: hypothetical protein VGD01_09610 [Candidatus Elarobacter sp.]